MKYNFFIHIILCFTLFTAGLTRSQAQHLSFGHIDKSDGLSNYSVTSIYQDKRGLMWFGTANGINLYNGNSIKTYQRSLRQPCQIYCREQKRLHILRNDDRGFRLRLK